MFRTPVTYEFKDITPERRKELLLSFGSCEAKILKREPNIVAQMTDIIDWVAWSYVHKKWFGNVPKFEPYHKA